MLSSAGAGAKEKKRAPGDCVDGKVGCRVQEIGDQERETERFAGSRGRPDPTADTQSSSSSSTDQEPLPADQSSRRKKDTVENKGRHTKHNTHTTHNTTTQQQNSTPAHARTALHSPPPAWTPSRLHGSPGETFSRCTRVWTTYPTSTSSRTGGTRSRAPVSVEAPARTAATRTTSWTTLPCTT